MAFFKSENHIRQPLLLKLFFVLILTGILLLSAVAGYLTFFSPEENDSVPPYLRRGLRRCTASLASEIGSPPNFEHAMELANELGFGIRIEQPNQDPWQSSRDLPVLEQTADKDSPWFRVLRGDTAYTFFFQPTSPKRELLEQVFWLIAVLSLILLVSFLVIRWLFRPLRWLMEGVDAISHGQLDYQISLRPGDEFESLGTAFNQMTQKINEMIEAREQLLSDLSHELRSPLARLQVSSEFIEKPELKENIKDDLREMDSMVSEVLEGARLSSPHGLSKKETNLAHLLSALTSKYEFREPGIVFTSSIAEGLAILPADEERLRSAFRNLIENGLKYSAHQSKPVEVTLSPGQGGFEITVADHGVGIPAEEHALVFEPFYRIDKSRTRSTGGYGLGLNLCKKVIEAHGGRISLLSSVGEGTLFRVWLPDSLGESLNFSLRP